MSSVMRRILLIGLLLLGCAACDAAKADYDRCVSLKQQDKLEEAADACEAAVKADPKSRSAAAATQLLTEIQSARIKNYADRTKANTDCTKAQLDWIEAKPADKAKFAAARAEKCRGLVPTPAP